MAITKRRGWLLDLYSDPEGGLSLTGALGRPKLGLIKYIIDATGPCWNTVQSRTRYPSNGIAIIIPPRFLRILYRKTGLRLTGDHCGLLSNLNFFISLVDDS